MKGSAIMFDLTVSVNMNVKIVQTKAITSVAWLPFECHHMSIAAL